MFCVKSNGRGNGSDLRGRHPRSMGCEEMEELMPPTTRSFPLYIAKYDYESRTDNDLSFVAGDCLKIIKKEGEWWIALNEATGREGYIPSNYVAEQKSIDSKPWYMGKIKRSEAEKLLQLELNAVSGTFLIRDSETTPGDYSLSMSCKDTVRHYRIRYLDNEGFFISQRVKFSTVEELVAYYGRSADGLCTTLARPARAIEKPQTAGLSKTANQKWEIDRKRIKLNRILGTGHFGEVWEGTWNGTTSVAVKTLKKGTMAVQEFLQEASLMKKLRHPKLIQLYAVCTREEPLYIITELMTHGDLLHYLRDDSGHTLLVPQLVEMASQVASGMAYLESQNYVHRDLAARNVLVGEYKICKIADFGLARLIDEEVYLAHTRCKFPVKWTAPEAAFYKRFSVKSDVWSFGIVLYEIFTYGSIPYPQMTNPEVLENISQGYRMSCPCSCPQWLYAMMLECWRETPITRPTFESLQWRLEEFQTVTDREYRNPDQSEPTL